MTRRYMYRCTDCLAAPPWSGWSPNGRVARRSRTPPDEPGRIPGETAG